MRSILFGANFWPDFKLVRDIEVHYKEFKMQMWVSNPQKGQNVL